MVWSYISDLATNNKSKLNLNIFHDPVAVAASPAPPVQYTEHTVSLSSVGRPGQETPNTTHSLLSSSRNYRNYITKISTTTSNILMQINTERLTALNVGTLETYLQTSEIISLRFFEQKSLSHH